MLWNYAMTEAERRQHPRFNPRGLKASIFLEPPHDPSKVEGEVVDISYTGIKIKLNTPTAAEMDGKIRIELFLPDSGIPFSISGILKHHNNSGELGLHYADSPGVDVWDSFMFECFKLSKN
jgi:c-di-GMP-binding flagellar brake protein YcgR